MEPIVAYIPPPSWSQIIKITLKTLVVCGVTVYLAALALGGEWHWDEPLLIFATCALTVTGLILVSQGVRRRITGHRPKLIIGPDFIQKDSRRIEQQEIKSIKLDEDVLKNTGWHQVYIRDNQGMTHIILDRYFGSTYAGIVYDHLRRMAESGDTVSLRRLRVALELDE